jgi:hypothetical protein
MEIHKSPNGYLDFNFSVGIKSVNYYHLWLIQNPNKQISAKEIYILKCISEFEIKLYEQAAISYYSPNINHSERPVTFSFTHVNISEHENYSDPRYKKIVAYGLDGEIYSEYESLSLASTMLGLMPGIINYHLNIENHFIFCPGVGKSLHLVHPLLPIRQKAEPNYPLFLPSIKGIDLKTLDPDYFYVFLEDKTTVIGKFTSLKEFAVKSLISPGKAGRYLNKEYLFSIPSSSEGILNLITDLNLQNKIKSLIKHNNIYVYVCSNPEKAQINTTKYNLRNEPVLSFDLKEDMRKREHLNPTNALLDLLKILNITAKNVECSVTKLRAKFTSNFITGKGLETKKIFKGRFLLIFKKDSKENEIPKVDSKALSSSLKTFRRTSSVISIDLLNNLQIIIHENSEKARLEILEKLGMKTDKLIDRNFTNSYIIPSKRNNFKPTLFKKRFHFLLVSDYDPNNLPDYVLENYNKLNKKGKK